MWFDTPPKTCSLCGKEIKTIIYSEYKNHILLEYDEECFLKVNQPRDYAPFGEVTDSDGSLD